MGGHQGRAQRVNYPRIESTQSIQRWQGNCNTTIGAWAFVLAF